MPFQFGTVNEAVNRLAIGVHVILTAILLLPGLTCAQGETNPGRLSAEQDLPGHWEGELSHLEQTYPVRMDITRNDAVWEITIDVPEYLIYGAGTRVNESAGWWTITSELLPDTEIRVQLKNGQLVGQCTGFCGVTSEVVLDRDSSRPVRYRYTNIEFTNGDGRLKGTLVQPDGEGPFPAIVWTHGSGQDTRSTFYYTGRAHLMAQHGIASLIYDKRGAGESTGSRFWDLDVLVDDALAAVVAIKSRADVDSSAIGIAGFSQGGWIAPATAARENDIDFVIVGATPGVSGGDQNIFSMANRMRRDGESDETIAAAEQFVTRLYEFYATGENRDAMSTALEKASSADWYDNKWVSNVLFIPEDGLPNGPNPIWEPFARDPMDSWRHVQVPVLSMWGGDDIDVPAELSRDRISRVLEEIGNSNVTLKIFEGASHGMWQAENSGRWDWPRQAEGAHQLMVAWVLEQTRR
ncbi:MAG: alpha/beta hydrolase family protein [Pirellulaceae bacterium]